MSSNVEISTLAVSKILTSGDSDNLQQNVSMVNGDIYIANLLYPKQGLAFNNVKYYGSKTEFEKSGDYMIVRTDGDPYPAKAGASTGYNSSTPSNDINTVRTWYDDPNALVEQSSVYKFTYRGGTAAPSTNQSQVLVSSGGINGIFNNGASFLSPLGGTVLPDTTPLVMKSNSNYYLNAYFFINFLGKDLAGHPEEGGEYHYHIGTFLYNMWNNATFYNSIDYYKNTYYTLNISDNAYFSDSRGGSFDHMRHSTGHSKIVGFCFDGYPIYGPFGYTNATDEKGGVKLMTSSYRLKTSFSTDRPYSISESIDLKDYCDTARLTGHKHSYYNDRYNNDKNKITMSAGAYTNDYEYVSGLGTLDYYNGRYTKTPDYPNGTYAYFITLDSSGVPQYPYVVGNSSVQQRTFTETTSVYCTISSNMNSITSGTATITFTMSKVPTNFTIDDITLSGNGTSNGSLSNFTPTSSTVYTVTYTPPSNTSAAISMVVAAGKFTDADGNSNYVSNTLSLAVNTVVTTSNSSSHTIKYMSNEIHVNALYIEFTGYAGGTLKWTTSDTYAGTYVNDTLVNGDANTTQYHHIVASSDSLKFIKAQIKNEADSNYTTVAIIYINNTGYMDIILDESVTTIANGAFARGGGTYVSADNIYKISNIYLPKSVTQIGDDSFSGFTGNIYIESGSMFTSNSSVFPSTCNVVENASLSDITENLTASLSNVTNSPIVGASVYYVDSQGNMLTNSPIATTDAYGDFDINTYVTDSAGNNRDFSNEPLKITGGANTLTGQAISYWYAKAGTTTMTPVTNLLFYCKDDSLTNYDITSSIGIDDSHDFSNYNYYKVMTETDKTTDPTTYSDAFKANNLGNAINVFATISAYFLMGINDSTIDVEYDAMMRSIANISTNNNGVNEFAQLFGTDYDACKTIVKDRIRNKFENTAFTSDDKTTAVNAIATRIASLITCIMSSPDKATTDIYELKGYNVTSYVNILTTSLGNNYSVSTDKTTLLNTYDTNLGYIFNPAITSASTTSVYENTTDIAYTITTNLTSIPLSGLVYSISGTDANKFIISSTGAITFVASPNYGNPTDTSGDNNYEIIVRVSDTGSSSTEKLYVEQAVTITVKNINNAVIITSATSQNVKTSNITTSTVVYSITATSTVSNSQFTYSISGTDASLFQVNNTGEITFANSLSYQNPTHSAVYKITVTASYGGNSAQQNVTINLTELVLSNSSYYDAQGVKYKLNGNSMIVSGVYSKYHSAIVIPTTVTYNGGVYSITTIGSLAFNGCSTLTSVSMPNVTSIGSYAFVYCSGLTSVSMPVVTSIGSNAFYSCGNMIDITSYIYSDELTRVYPNANATLYIGNTNTTYFTTSANACVYKILTEGTSIGTVSVVSSSSSLSGSLILNNVTRNNTSYTITEIDSSAFRGNSKLTSISIPNVTSIGSYVFDSCTGLTSVSMPVVTSTGSLAFLNCSGLTSIYMPVVQTIGSNAFYGCDSMNDVTSYIYSNELTRVYPNANATLYIVSSDTTYFTTSANACVYKILTEGTVSVFTCSSSLSGSLTLNNVTRNNTSYTITDIGYSALANLINLTSVSMPNVTSVGSLAFNGCTGLTSVSMSAVTAIGSNAFNSCRNLSSIYFQGDYNASFFNNSQFSSIASNATAYYLAGNNTWTNKTLSGFAHIQSMTTYLTVSNIVVSNKTYDGTTSATVTGSLVGVSGSDIVTLSLSGTFASANVGTQSVTITGTLGGANAGNYTLTQPTGNYYASITESITTLTANEIATLTNSQIAAITTLQIAALTTSVISAITTSQITAITTSQIAALTTSVISAITTSQITALTTSQITAITTSQIAALTTSVISAITTDQITALTTSVISAITTDQITALTTSLVSALTSDQVVAITTDQVNTFSLSQISALDDINVLSTKQVSSLSSSGVSGITSSQVTSLNTAQLNSIGTTK